MRTWRLRALAGLATVRRHPRHLLLFAVVAGLLLGPVAPLAALVAAAGAAALGGRPALALGAVVAVLAGAALAQARAAALGPGTLPALAGRGVEGRAILLEPVRRWRNGTAVARVRLRGAVEVRGGAPARTLPPGAYDLDGECAVVHVRRGRAPPGLRVGGELRLRGSVAALADFEAFQRRRCAYAAIEVYAWSATGRARGGLAGVLDAARERAARGLRTGLHPPEAALLRGMVLGQDEAIGTATRDEFRRSGLAHLIAVSGQNVLLLSILVLALGALGDVPLRGRLGAAIVVVALYVPLAGGSPSIQRAGVMGIAGLVAALAGRPASRWYAVGLAAAVTLALNPRSAGEPGWQLSFAAVVGLIALAPPLREAMTRRQVPDAVAEAAAITLAATIATAPLLAFHFQQVSLASLPANLLAAAAVAPIMWLGMLGIAVAQLAPPLAAPLNVLCAPLLGYLEWVAHTAAAAPGAAVPVRVGGPAVLAAAYAALAAAWLAALKAWRLARERLATASALAWAARAAGTADWIPPGAHAGDAVEHRAPPGAVRRLQIALLTATPARRRAYAAGLAAALMVASALGIAALRSRHALRLAPGELVVSFLDVGQGDATLLQTGATSVLVDTGPPGGPILRRLDEAGVRRLDALILTHAEADHEGMALPIIAAHRPRLVLDGGAGWPTAVQRSMPAALAGVGGRAVAAHAGQVVRLGPLRLNVLWPPRPPPGWRPGGPPNDRAVVTHVQDGDFDLLLPADAESNVTAGLQLPPVEALKVAHHGSADDGLPALLARLRPRIAAIEVGRRNTYGHPTKSALAALSVVPELVRTDRDGTVRLHVAGGRMWLEGRG